MPNVKVDHYEVFRQDNGFTFWRTRSLTAARIMSADVRRNLDYVAVNSDGIDICPSRHPEAYV